MILTRTVTKKVLEKIVHTAFSKFGSLSSSSLLDSLKLLGFYYATTAGLSITIEDLKTPEIKKQYLQTTEEDIVYVSNQWQQGIVSDTERFQTIIARWNNVTDALKNRIVDYYENFDPANNLYIMAFSGARGNLSQVRQLVGMRGLMSDQEGKIIDLPIKTNFREGLTSLDYLISSYGARKGIVDTALKTADSGYLTRRLIYLAQDLVIREKDCSTNQGILVSLKTTSDLKSVVGRFLFSTYSEESTKNTTSNKNVFLTNIILKDLKKQGSTTLKIRSPLTCASLNSICQYCYGWDLSKEMLISLGEAVGILAAQSIGEPGTQLTMRTFHTGGVFTSEAVQQLIAPFSGQLIFPSFLPVISVRTNQGKQVLRVKQEIILRFRNWKGEEKLLPIRPGSFLYLTSSRFLKQGELIAEYIPESVNLQKRRLKSIYTRMEGEIRFEGICRSISKKDKQEISLTEEDGVLWIDSGKVFPLSKETSFKFPKQLISGKAIGYQKFISPYNGVVFINEAAIMLLTTKKRYELNINEVLTKSHNYLTKVSFFVKNYQYVDPHTILGKAYIFPKTEGKIYAIKKKRSRTFLAFFLITESDIWKISSDQVNGLSSKFIKKGLIKTGEPINEVTKSKLIGRLLKKEGNQLIFQHSLPTFISSGTLLSYKGGDLIPKGQKLATLIDSTQQTEDIVQGLPKIEDLIEARIPKEKALLCSHPGIYLGTIESNEENSKRYIQRINYKKQKSKEIFEFNYEKTVSIERNEIKKQKEEKSLILLESITLTKRVVKFKGRFWNFRSIPREFQMISKPKRNEFGCQFPFTTEQQKILDLLTEIRKEVRITGREKTLEEEMLFVQRPKARRLLVPTQGSRHVTTWEKVLGEAQIESIFKLTQDGYTTWKNIKEIYSNSKTNHFILKTFDDELFLLELIDPCVNYTIQSEKNIIPSLGMFVDSGEPLTEGLVDPHEFLSVLFYFHITMEDTLLATKRSLNKFQILLLHSIQSIYQSQGVTIGNNHIELIVRQLTAKIKITSSGTTPFIPGEIHSFSYMAEIYKAFKEAKKNNENKNNLNSVDLGYHPPIFEPIFLSTTNSSLTKKGFLAAAGFQETKRVLTTAAIEGKADWFQGLKECVIIGRLIPAGTAFFTYKNNLNNLFLFKRKLITEQKNKI